MLGHVSDAVADVARRSPEDPHLSFGRGEQANQQLDEGGLAAAVGSYEAKQGTSVELEVEVGKHPIPAWPTESDPCEGDRRAGHKAGSGAGAAPQVLAIAAAA